MPSSPYPSLYQINTRVWLTELSRELSKRATLDDIPDAELDRIKETGFDWIWFLSVWQTGPAAQAISRANPEWRHEFAETLPDLKDADIAGSGFAIQNYTVHRDLGGDAALAGLRQRLQKRGLKLMLDFVPNHMAPDHPWVDEHPDYFVHGSETDLARAPQNYCRVQTKNGPLLLAYGRDPYFDGWPDTLQLNYGNPELQQAMSDELERIAGQCDGVRCDMAMLVSPDVFESTWGIRADLFWPKATEAVRRKHPNFQFMAEVYWDREWTMQQQGFDYTYDKRLYDRLRDGHARPVREHFHARLDYQNKMARFLENHDEPRAAATFSPEVHEAAAVITFLSPGLRFFIRDNSRGERNASRPIWFAGRTNRSIINLSSFTIGCFRCCAIRPCAAATGSCSNAFPLGMAIGPLIAFSPLLGKTGAESDYSHWLIMLPIRANAMSGSPLAIYATGSGDCRICSVRQNMIGTGTTSTHADSTWTCQPGVAMLSRCRDFPEREGHDRSDFDLRLEFYPESDHDVAGMAVTLR